MLDTLIREQSEASGLPGIEEQPAETALRLPPAVLALWVVLATVTMLFAGFTSAYLVRRTALDWVPVYAPPILWLNTVVLVLSSVGLELAKGAPKAGNRSRSRVWLLLTVGLGLVFLAGQVVAWSQLRAHGIFLPTSPHGSFLYMLTGVHAVHVLGGLAALVYVLAREWRPPASLAAADLLAPSAVYWHFVTGVWVFLYALLFVWR
jgi:cytochrome c oxidase subunit 3